MLDRYTTGRGLSADAAFVGLVDYGLFAEKLPAVLYFRGALKQCAGLPPRIHNGK